MELSLYTGAPGTQALRQIAVITGCVELNIFDLESFKATLVPVGATAGV